MKKKKSSIGPAVQSVNVVITRVGNVVVHALDKNGRAYEFFRGDENQFPMDVQKPAVGMAVKVKWHRKRWFIDEKSLKKPSKSLISKQ